MKLFIIALFGSFLVISGAGELAGFAGAQLAAGALLFSTVFLCGKDEWK